ncbi:MAG TPA: glycoside hydrolase family 3 protein [Arsenophonus apicola]|uniref:glycoside hydrolase family 3 protein n=1 Tax=Arsenophonus TaxID=637 RepID=UPI0015D7465F|nr:MULTISPECIES: glycoside hydrolase family 3 protein [Arsenophonus]UBX28791.1 glycoside hydrolase family 3 protein [Arsenophonus apicola]
MNKIALSLCLLSFFCSAKGITHQQLADLWQSPEKEAKQLVENMSFEEKLGQMLMLGFRHWGIDAEKNALAMTKLNPEIANIIHHYHLGSVILFRDNLIDSPQTVNLINALQQARSNLPLFISVDQEGGYVTRLRVGTEMPGNMALGATRSKQLSELVGMIHGYELTHLGFNFNFAPVVDINNNQNNPIIGVRSYSDRPQLVAEMANGYIQGIHRYAVLTAIKHFPGHGNVTADSHLSLPTINISQQQWRKFELLPFMHTMRNTDAIITAHIVMPALDNHKLTTLDNQRVGVPATLSKPILSGILRNKLNYQGLIITDAMDMGAIANNFDSNWVVKQAILAGNDIILMPLKITAIEDVTKLEQLYHYLKTEAQSDPELNRRISESAYRVVFSKLKNRISAQDKSAQRAQQVVAAKIDKDIENMVADNAITLIKNSNILPFQLKNNNKIVIFSDEKARNQLIKKHLLSIADELNINMATQDDVVTMMADDKTEQQFTTKMQNSDLIILATYNLKNAPINAQRILNVANRNAIPVVVISTNNPYDIAYLRGVKANIAIYGITGFDETDKNRNNLETNIRSGLRTLFLTPNKRLMNSPTGKLPVDIKTPNLERILYPYGYGLAY